MTSIPPAEPRPPPTYPPHGPRPPAQPKVESPSSSGLVRQDVPNSSQESQDDDGRPAKRRKLSGDVGPVDGEGQQAESKITLAEDFRPLSAVIRGKAVEEKEQAELPPLPRRPWLVHGAKRIEAEPKPTHRARSPMPVPNVPDTSLKTDAVPQWSSCKLAAFFPWIGKHDEDVLSAENVKGGAYDKAPSHPEKETSSARVPLYHTLKHRSGLECLSTLFTAVLEAKNKHGLISSASSFKPPPRVTLAEGKRKSWIADLADQDVPLRKLSRTIPQGIRGQGLLDQCIQNNVPLGRAIWFAKCVGANEIRTLKRKGTTPQAAVGTETKWIRDWTINAEQFIESILARIGQSNWKAEIQYALRLTTRLCLENLLDRDHYLDWIVKSFSAASDERLPFWLMVVHIHKQDIARFRRRGRMLAEALLAKYTSLNYTTSELVHPLLKRLRDAIKGVAMHRRYCFLMPDSWPSIRQSLVTCLDLDNPKEAAVLTRLDLTNERSMGANRKAYTRKLSPEDRIVKILDTVQAPFDVNSLSQTLLSACAQMDILVPITLSWACSRFRRKSYRIYLASRLLRRWQRKGHEVQDFVLSFCTSLHDSPTTNDTPALRHLCAEMSRSDIIPMSRYMQWLNVRGLPQSNTVFSIVSTTAKGESLHRQISSDHSNILMDIECHRSGGHLANSRNLLLNRAGYDIGLEADAVATVIDELKGLLQSLAMSSLLDSVGKKSLQSLLKDWNWNVRGQVTQWIRSFVVEIVQRRMSSNESNNSLTGRLLSEGQFDLIRFALETLEDEAVLADVVGLCSSFNHEPLQAALVETVSRHAESFSAIGALETLQTTFSQIYLSLRHVKSTMPLLATALLEICSTFPDKGLSAKALQQDLIRGDRERAMAACSPFSDGIAESLQHAESTFIDDFEAVLQSEPRMQEHTMKGLFALLTDRIEKQQGTIVGEDALFSYCQLMAKLRWCRRPQYDDLLRDWLIRALSKYAATFTRNLVFSLIGAGCLTVDILYSAISSIGTSTVVSHHRWLVSSASAAEHPCGYAVATRWQKFIDTQPASALELLGHANEADSTADVKTSCFNFVLQESHDLELLPIGTRKMLTSSIETLFDARESVTDAVRDALHSLDVLSVRFVQVRSRLLFHGGALSDHEAAETLTNSLSELQSPTSHACRMGYLSSVIDAMGSQVKDEVRQIIEDHVLDILPVLPGSKSSDGAIIEPAAIEKLRIATEQAFQICPSETPSPAKSKQRMIDALSQILRYLGGGNLSRLTTTSLPGTSPTAASLPLSQTNTPQQLSMFSEPLDRNIPLIVVDYLRILLQILCLQRSAPTATPSGTSAPTPTATKVPLQPPSKQSSESIKILTYLASIITHPALLLLATTHADPKVSAATRETIDFAYDVLATYLDSATDEGRMLLARIVRDKLKSPIVDGRLKWLFGSVSTCGSEMEGGEELGAGLLVARKEADSAASGPSKEKVLGEWKPKPWEVLQTGGTSDADVSVGLGLFGARRI